MQKASLGKQNNILLCFTGYYLLLISSLGQSGDKVMFLSPPNKFYKPGILTFFYHMQSDSSDLTVRLTVYKYSQRHTFDEQLFTVMGNQGSMWQQAIVCLPIGTYSLAFVGTIGLTSKSDIALDNVNIDYEYESPSLCSSLELFVSTGKYVRSPILK